MKTQVRRYILTSVSILLLIITGYPCSAQKSGGVLNVKGNTLYIGIDNYLSAFIEGVDCDSLILTTDDGDIEGNGCGWSIRVAGKAEANIQTWYINNGDTIKGGVSRFRVQPLPPPKIAIANRYNPDSLSINQIMNAPYITACILNFEININYTYKNFTTIILRNDSCIFSEIYSGQKLSENLITFLSQCQTGDRLIICAAEIYGIMGKEKVAPVEYVLKKD